MRNNNTKQGKSFNRNGSSRNFRSGGNRSDGNRSDRNRSGGNRFGGNRFGRNNNRNFRRNNFNRSPREMHKAICSECGKECEVPFKPTEGKPVYCNECFEKHKPQRF